MKILIFLITSLLATAHADIKTVEALKEISGRYHLTQNSAKECHDEVIEIVPDAFSYTGVTLDEAISLFIVGISPNYNRPQSAIMNINGGVVLKEMNDSPCYFPWGCRILTMNIATMRNGKIVAQNGFAKQTSKGPQFIRQIREVALDINENSITINHKVIDAKSKKILVNESCFYVR